MNMFWLKYNYCLDYISYFIALHEGPRRQKFLYDGIQYISMYIQCLYAHLKRYLSVCECVSLVWTNSVSACEKEKVTKFNKITYMYALALHCLDIFFYSLPILVVVIFFFLLLLRWIYCHLCCAVLLLLGTLKLKL